MTTLRNNQPTTQSLNAWAMFLLKTIAGVVLSGLGMWGMWVTNSVQAQDVKSSVQQERISMIGSKIDLVLEHQRITDAKIDKLTERLR